MTWFTVLVVAATIMMVGGLIAFLLAAGLITIVLAVIVLASVVILAILIFLWRITYPWLVRMGRWSAQLKNLIFLAFVLAAVGFVLIYVLGIPPIVIYILLGGIFGLLLLLAIVVWLVRLWHYTWPPGRNLFWDLWFRIMALGWRILVGIPIGITWFFYHPPLRWLVAALLFYLRGISAAVAWLLYNPPLRSITIAGLFVTRLIAWFTAWLLYNPPIRWVIQFGLFFLRLIARFISTVMYGIVSWWPVQGVKGVLRKGLTVESKSYQDYKYAQDDGSGAA